MKNLFKIGDKVKWGKRKEVYEVVDKWNAGDSIGYYIHKGNDDTSTIVSPSELTKVPKKVVELSFKVTSKKNGKLLRGGNVLDGEVVLYDEKTEEVSIFPKTPKRAVKKEVPMSREFHAYASPKDKAEVARINKELRINRAMQDKILSELEEIDIPTNLRKVGIDYGHEDLVDSVAYLWASARNKKEVNNWPNGYTLAFVLAGILFVIAYCVGMARI